jgi:hypothetical protein
LDFAVSKFRNGLVRQGPRIFVTAAILTAVAAASAQAGQVNFNLRLAVHDYGELLASAHACRVGLEETKIKNSILDIVSGDPNLDENQIGADLDEAVRKQAALIVGCSVKTVAVARQNVDRDATDLMYAIDIHH